MMRRIAFNDLANIEAELARSDEKRLECCEAGDILGAEVKGNGFVRILDSAQAAEPAPPWATGSRRGI